MPKTPYGLRTKEAAERLKAYGHNEINETSNNSPFKILIRQIKSNSIIYLLLAAALLSYYVNKNITAYTLLGVIVVVVVTGFIQEYRAEKAVAALRGLLMAVSFVYRDGKKVEIPSAELVVGDVVALSMGEKVPADCRLLELTDLKVDEAILTGESAPVSKQISATEEYDHNNLVYMGSYIVNGKCLAEVVHTGMNTKFGKIADMISSADKELPLQKKLSVISKFLVFTGLTMAITMGALVAYQAPELNNDVISDILILAIAVAVSSFPEGMPVVLITALSVSASRMARKNAIVNRMSVIETLGETTLICSDKTGTITKGEATVRFVISGEKLYEVTGVGFNGHGDFKDLEEDVIVTPRDISDLGLLIEASVLCNDTEITRTGEDHEYKVRGTPTEGALRIMGAKASIFKSDFQAQRLQERPFNSDRKMMSVLIEFAGERFVFAKGAPEVLLEKCSGIQLGDKNLKLTSSYLSNINAFNQQMTSEAFRTLAIAYKRVEDDVTDYSENDFVFLGLVAIEDPPREEAAEAIRLCQSAGIKVKMITGDNKNTAVSIGKQVGLEGKVLQGYEIDGLSDDELLPLLPDISIFARVKPEHKLRLIELFKQQGEIVAMTGDGVNDAPALKAAHVGIAMGKNGTDVSRSVADLTLKDDNFATIVHAIKEGRTVFKNIRKFVTYQLSCNLGVLVVLFGGVLFAPILGWQIPVLIGLQILVMNLLTDNMPAITLGVNPTSNDIMHVKPKAHASILNKGLFYSLISSGLILGILSLVALYTVFNIFGSSFDSARSTAFLTMILLQIVAAFNFRSFRKKILDRTPFANQYLFYASSASLFIASLVIFTPLNKIFETVSLNPGEIALVLSLTIFGAIIFDLKKHLDNKAAWYTRDTH